MFAVGLLFVSVEVCMYICLYINIYWIQILCVGVVRVSFYQQILRLILRSRGALIAFFPLSNSIILSERLLLIFF